jgi:hypothetical protein
MLEAWRLDVLLLHEAVSACGWADLWSERGNVLT